MGYRDTIDSQSFGQTTFEVQKCFTDNGEIYIVSILLINESMATSLDIFKSEEYYIAYNYYKSLINSVIVTNNLDKELFEK